MDVKREEVDNQGPGPNTQPAHAQLTSSGFSFLVPVPQRGEDLETTIIKVHSLADAVANEGILVFPKIQVTASGPSREAEDLAKKQMMTRMERSEYEQWKAKKITPPPFDWAVYRGHVAPDGVKTFTERAAAMDVIWERQGTTSANASYLSNSMSEWLPLVKAVVKVLKAQTQLEEQGVSTGLTASQMAELETLREINDTIDANVTRAMEQIEAIIEAADVLKLRQKALERGLLD